MKYTRIFWISILCFTMQITFAQSEVDPVNEIEKRQVVDSVTQILNRAYVFPEVASKMKVSLIKRLENGAYDPISNPSEFAETLTTDLQNISNDKHLRVQFSPDDIRRRRNASLSEKDSIDLAQRRLRHNRMENYGFKNLSILEGNIGYLELTGFFGVNEEAGATAHAAMNLLSNANALIIDLRQNGGGSPSMIQLITSYLYGPQRVHLNSFYNRPEDNHTQTWTLPYVPGKRRPDMDVYVLTSRNTFSAAEEFSYNLKHLERATLIGEVTGGGAHPGGTRIATDRFTVWVPDGRAINPITKTNWEGVGVKPHIEVEASNALKLAQITALEKMLKSSEGDARNELEWTLEALQAQNRPVMIESTTLKSYAGTFGPRTIQYKDGRLFYQREGRTAFELIPLSEDRFMISEIPYFRIHIDKKDGQVVALIGQYRDGHSDRSPKTN